MMPANREDSADERLFHARDAHSSAMLLSLLVLIGQLMSLVSTGAAPQGIPAGVRAVLLAASAAAIGYLWATRARASERAAWALCAGFIGIYLVLIPWAAVRWGELGRPWEAFVAPQLGVIGLALTVPRSFWLGVAAVLVIVLEGLCILTYFAIIGTAREQLPVTEPATMIIYASVGVAILVARRNRRQLCLQHVRAAAEATTRTRLSAFIPAMIDDLGSQLGVVSAALRRNGWSDRRRLERGQAAVARLTNLRDQLGRLIASPPPLTVAPARPVDPDAAALTEAERELYARDAYQAARVIGIMLLVCLLAALWAARHRSLLLQLLWAGHAVVVLSCLGILQRTWIRPSERLGFFLFVPMIAPLLVIFVYSQAQWAHGHEAFEPLLATKLLMLILALAAPRHRWLTLALVALVAAEGFTIFYGYHFETLRNRIPGSEPWPLLLHLFLAAALLSTREQRRVASVRILRADREAAAQARHAAIVLTVLDRVGSPLQVLLFTMGELLEHETDPAQREALALALRELSNLPARVPQIDRRAYDYIDLSPDASHLPTPPPG